MRVPFTRHRRTSQKKWPAIEYQYRCGTLDTTHGQPRDDDDGAIGESANRRPPPHVLRVSLARSGGYVLVGAPLQTEPDELFVIDIKGGSVTFVLQLVFCKAIQRYKPVDSSSPGVYHTIYLWSIRIRPAVL